MRALEQLRQMPAVFTNRDLMRISGETVAWTKLALNRWKKQGMVKAAGQRLGIYYNLVIDPDWQSHLPTAIRMAFPSAVVMGATVLHRHGWITQIPRYLYIAVLKTPSQPEMEGVLAFGRPRTWYAKFSPWGEKIYGLSALTPENALRDCYLYAHKTDMWCPEEDDLDLPENFTPLKTRLARGS